MQTFIIPEAEPHFARLVKMAANGEAIMVAEGGKPVAKVVPVQDLAPAPQSGFDHRRFGFMLGEIIIPDDFDRMDEDEIAAMFHRNK